MVRFNTVTRPGNTDILIYAGDEKIRWIPGYRVIDQFLTSYENYKMVEVPLYDGILKFQFSGSGSGYARIFNFQDENYVTIDPNNNRIDIISAY